MLFGSPRLLRKYLPQIQDQIAKERYRELFISGK